MIYESVNPVSPIRQGDIFCGLPRFDVSLNQMLFCDPETGQPVLKKWTDLKDENRPLSFLVSAQMVNAIVITQDCDAIRSRDITLCEIRRFSDVNKLAKDAKTPKTWLKMIVQQARLNLKWFYLPPSEIFGFKEKMGVDFMVTIRLPREELEQLTSLRPCRLNDIADEHFRERISEFFRRYPYDEWYSLNDDELEAYEKEHGEVQNFPWQKRKE